MIIYFVTDSRVLGKQCRTRSDCSLKEQSDHGLHSLPFYLHLLHKFLYGKFSFFELKGYLVNILEYGNPKVYDFYHMYMYVYDGAL